MRKNTVSLKPMQCQSCGEKAFQRRDGMVMPYCSVVCRTLGRHGLGWRMNPYRIVDLVVGTVLATGAEFDLTEKGVAELGKK